MRHRMLSLVLAALAILVIGGSASAQLVRMDQIIGFAGTPGVPSVAEGTFVPAVQATDATSAAFGSDLVPYVTDLDAWFATNFGWRSSAPVTYLLASDAESVANLGISLTGGNIDRLAVQSRPAFLLQVTQPGAGIPAGEWVILVNMDLEGATTTANQINNAIRSEIGIPPIPRPVTTEEGLKLIQQSMARELALLMETQLAGNAGPIFYREGLADTISFRIVPGTPQESGRALAVANFLAINNFLPTLSDLETSWNVIAGPGGLNFDMARGIAFLSANTVFNQVGSGNALQVLTSTAAGQSFDEALQSITGFSIFDLNNSYQSLIPAPVTPTTGAID